MSARRRAVLEGLFEGLDVTVGSRNRKESENGVEQGVVRCAKFLGGVDIVDRAESTGVGDGTVRWVMWISEGVDDEVGDGIYRVAGTVLEEYFSSHCSANESGVSFGITQLQQVVLTVRAKIFSILCRKAKEMIGRYRGRDKRAASLQI